MCTTVLMSYSDADLIQSVVAMLGICVALPITIVAMLTKSRSRKIDRKMDILEKAVENGLRVDPALLVVADEGDGKYKLKKNLLNRLTFGIALTLVGGLLIVFSDVESLVFFITLIGIACSAIGLGLLVSYFVGRRMLAPEIKKEEEKLMDVS